LTELPVTAAQDPNASAGELVEPRALRALYEISLAIGGVLDLAELARLVTFHARDLLDADGSVVHLWDEETQLFTELDSNHIDGGIARGGRLQIGQGIAGQTALQRSMLVIEDYPAWPQAVPGAVESGLRSALAVPLLVNDRLVGVLATRFTKSRTITDQQTHLLKLLAAQVAPALDAVRLHAAQGRLLERERALHEVSRALASDLDEAHVLDLAVRHAARLLDAPFARIWLHDAERDELRCASAEGFLSPGMADRRLPRQSLVGQSGPSCLSGQRTGHQNRPARLSGGGHSTGRYGARRVAGYASTRAHVHCRRRAPAARPGRRCRPRGLQCAGDGRSGLLGTPVAQHVRSHRLRHPHPGREGHYPACQFGRRGSLRPAG
jgi:GAF domain-containing protein